LNPTFLTISEAAKALGVSAITARRWFDGAVLPGFRQGRTRRVYAEFVKDLLAEIRTGRQLDLKAFAAAWSDRPTFELVA